MPGILLTNLDDSSFIRIPKLTGIKIKTNELTKDHLVFFIHGVGQQYETYGNIEHHVSTIQKNTQEMLESLHTQKEQEEIFSVEFVVIEWHSILHALVDTKMDQATLDNVPKVRLATNQWLMDCMYYFSKPYGQFILDTICRQCNEAYHNYGNPKHVHMIGFSLGGVAAYDILSMQWNHNDVMDEPTTAAGNATATPSTTTAAPAIDNNDDLLAHESCFSTTTPDIWARKLDFEVEHLFTCGSPLAAALIFRGLDYMHYRPPSCTRIHNIFHPYDPLGYRLEPMINSNFVGVSPVRLARAPPRRRRLLLLPKIPDLGIKTFITNYMMLNNNSDNVTPSNTNNISSDEEMKDTTTAATTATTKATTITIIEGEEEYKDSDEFVVHQVVKEDTQENHHQHHDEQEREEQTATGQGATTDQEEESGEPEEFYPRRIDYMLNETVIDTYASEWIIAIKSHFRYWANRDLAFHIAKSLLE